MMSSVVGAFSALVLATVTVSDSVSALALHGGRRTSHPSSAFLVPPTTDRRCWMLQSATVRSDDIECAAASSREVSRREALSRILLSSSAALLSPLSPASPALAADDDDSLTSRMFNPDGSLKSGSVEEEEAKSRLVATAFPSASDDSAAVVSLDGAKVAESGVALSYSVPEKWSYSSEKSAYLYLDAGLGALAPSARRIAVYRLPAPSSEKVLDKATTKGVGKSLGLTEAASGIGLEDTFVKSLLGADVVSGKKSVRDGVKYYEFDMAVAPATCDEQGKGGEVNLGLGFCPYDTIVLLGAAVLEEDKRMYVIYVEADRDMWKRANADLKRVRGSFRADAAAQA